MRHEPEIPSAWLEKAFVVYGSRWYGLTFGSLRPKIWSVSSNEGREIAKVGVVTSSAEAFEVGEDGGGALYWKLVKSDFSRKTMPSSTLDSSTLKRRPSSDICTCALEAKLMHRRRR